MARIGVPTTLLQQVTKQLWPPLPPCSPLLLRQEAQAVDQARVRQVVDGWHRRRGCCWRVRLVALQQHLHGTEGASVEITGALGNGRAAAAVCVDGRRLGGQGGVSSEAHGSLGWCGRAGTSLHVSHRACPRTPGAAAHRTEVVGSLRASRLPAVHAQ